MFLTFYYFLVISHQQNKSNDQKQFLGEQSQMREELTVFEYVLSGRCLGTISVRFPKREPERSILKVVTYCRNALRQAGDSQANLWVGGDMASAWSHGALWSLNDNTVFLP